MTCSPHAWASSFLPLLWLVQACLVAFPGATVEGAKLQTQQDPLDGPGPLPAGVDGLLIAITRDRLKKFKEFLDKAPNPRQLANNRTSSGSTYLMEAAAYGRKEMVRYLLAQGAEPDARRQEDDKTALIIAALLAYVPVIDVLLEPGADWQANVDAVDSQGMSALMYAASAPTADVVKALLRRGASTSIRQRLTGMTALMYAAFNGQVASMRALVEDGKAKLEQKDETGRTALMWAAMGKHTPAVRYLVEKGAERLTVDDLGLSAADYQKFSLDAKAAERRHKEGHFSKWEARNRLTADGEL